MDEHPGATTSFPDKQSARQAAPGPQAQATNRFVRAATAKSRDFKITELGGGNRRLEFFSPANNPGYGKRYVQQIDDRGRVVRWYKETWGPGGLIETKRLRGAAHDQQEGRPGGTE
jgi:hypothetical protein